MAFVEINPRYRALLGRHGLTSPELFLALPAVIVSGHPDRHVAQVTVGDGPAAVAAFLKREHRIPWKDRLANAWAGFGFVSKSYREALTLRALQQIGVGCPEWIAVGEDRQGRAFLLVRGLADATDLRRFLRDRLSRDARARRRFARQLGEALARIHNAGFDHPDLYSKHVLVDPRTETFHFLDWQRSRRRRSVNWEQRCRDLAALDATLAEDRATPRERLACLRAYLRATATPCGGRHIANRIRQQTERLLRKPHIREARHGPLPAGEHAILWLDDEALCVTQEFWAELQGRIPDWLRLDRATARRGSSTTHTEVALSGGRRGLLVCRSCPQPLRWLWAGLRRRALVSPEVRQAGVLFRRQRQGSTAPRLLAFGQRRSFPWRTESFLLTEIAAPATEGGK
jgi:tRNA A-37 threonylcarbamoyl transferase component Bud32